MSKFEKGQIPWNKGKFGFMGANKTSFKKEDINERGKKSIGIPKIGHQNLVTTIEDRIACKSKNGKVYMHRKRIPYARYILQQNGIDVPKGFIVYHIDGNMFNNNIENLKVISRAELIKLNKAKS